MNEIVNRILSYLREPRKLLLLIMLYCAILLLFALVLVQVVDLIPCPLCIVQRFFYAFIGLTALVGYMRWSKLLTERVAGGVIVIFSFVGGAVALRQVWMQRFPVGGESTGCAVSFGSFIDDVILAFGGTGNCGIIDWTFMGLSIADWSLIAFTLIALTGAWIVYRGVGKETESFYKRDFGSQETS